MAHTFLNIGFETESPFNIASWFVNGPDTVAADGYLADDWTTSQVATGVEFATFVVLLGGSVQAQSPAEHFGGDWLSNELALFEYDDPGTQLSKAIFDVAISPMTFEDLEEGWDSNQNYLFAAGPQLAASTGAQSSTGTLQPNPRGGILIESDPSDNPSPRMLVVRTGQGAVGVGSGITILRLTSNNSTVLLGDVVMGTATTPLLVGDLIAVDDAGTERYFVATSDGTNAFIQEFFPNTKTFSAATTIGGIGSIVRNLAYDGTSLWWTRLDTVGATNFLERAALATIGNAPNTPNLSIDLAVGVSGAIEYDSANGVILVGVGTTLSRREIVGGIETGSIAHGSGVNAIAFGGGFAWTADTAAVLRKITVSSMTVTDSHSLAASPFQGTIAGIAYDVPNAKLLMIGTDSSDTMIAQKWDATASPLSAGANGSAVAYGAFGDNATLLFLPGIPLRLVSRTDTATDVVYIVDPEVDDADGALFIAFPMSGSGAPTVSQRFAVSGVSGVDDFEDFEEGWSNFAPEAYSLALGSTIAALFDSGSPEAFEDFEDEWNSGSTYHFDITTTTQTFASFDDIAPEAFEDFEETDFTEWKIIVNVAQAGDYKVTINSIDHVYTATGVDTLTTIRDGLVIAINAGFQNVTASPEVASNVLQVADDDLPPDFTLGVEGPASNDLEKQPTDEATLWTQSGQMRTV